MFTAFGKTVIPPEAALQTITASVSAESKSKDKVTQHGLRRKADSTGDNDRKDGRERERG